MITLARLSIEEVLPFTGKNAPSKLYHVNGVPYMVKMSSLRYQTFQKSLSCVQCGLEGEFFLLQYSPMNKKKSKGKIVCHIENCELCAMKLASIAHNEPEGWEKPHFNLYHMGKKGGLILMTKDHVIPKSKNGPNRIENLQTMCMTCNIKKGNTMPGEEIASLTKIGD